MRELLISNPQVSVWVENTPLEILEYLEMDNSNQFNMFSTKKNGQPFVAPDRHTPKNVGPGGYSATAGSQ